MSKEKSKKENNTPWWHYVLFLVGISGVINGDASTPEGLTAKIIGVICLLILTIIHIKEYRKDK